jgi:hypothetical protein
VTLHVLLTGPPPNFNSEQCKNDLTWIRMQKGEVRTRAADPWPGGDGCGTPGAGGGDQGALDPTPEGRTCGTAGCREALGRGTRKTPASTFPPPGDVRISGRVITPSCGHCRVLGHHQLSQGSSTHSHAALSVPMFSPAGVAAHRVFRAAA